MTEPKRPSTSSATRPSGASGSSRRTSTSPSGSRRAGRRETTRRRYDEPTFLERFRTPLIIAGAVAIVAVLGAIVFTSASEPAYACTTIDTVQPPVEGQIGQVQPDMGNTHVGRGDKVTFPVCPPASGRHINQIPYGPIPARFYGPEDTANPNGWIHNLEHGGLVLLYSCDKGACDDASQARLRDVYATFPNSPVCGLPPGTISPVIARFEQMPTRYAAIVWDRVLYMDELDVDQVFEFYARYAEVVDEDGNFLAPPEPQCAPPSPSPSPAESPSADPGASAEPSPSAS